MPREGHRRLSGTPEQERVSVTSDAVGKMLFSIIQCNGLSLSLKSPRCRK